MEVGKKFGKYAKNIVEKKENMQLVTIPRQLLCNLKLRDYQHIGMYFYAVYLTNWHFFVQDLIGLLHYMKKM